jgi:peptidylprolyl isomerase
MKVENGKTVKMHYEGKLEDGTLFDTSQGKEPLEFVFGAGSIIPGLERELEGLDVGDKKEVFVAAKDAYGETNPEATQKVEMSQFPSNITPEVGMQLMAQTEAAEMPVTITEVAEEYVIVDFNHPLAGKNLIFNVEIVDVQ